MEKNGSDSSGFGPLDWKSENGSDIIRFYSIWVNRMPFLKASISSIRFYNFSNPFRNFFWNSCMYGSFWMFLICWNFTHFFVMSSVTYNSILFMAFFQISLNKKQKRCVLGQKSKFEKKNLSLLNGQSTSRSAETKKCFKTLINDYIKTHKDFNSPQW